MKKIFAFFLIGFISIMNLFGQNHSLGIISGLNVSNQTSNVLDDSENRKGIIGGVCYEFSFPNSLTLGIDALFSQKGFQANTLPNSTSVESIGLDSKINYLSLPLKLGYKTGEDFLGFIKIGLIPSFLQTIDSELKIFDSQGHQITDIKEDIAPFDLSASLEFGIGYLFTRNCEFFSSISYSQGLTSFNNSVNADFYHYEFAVLVGMKYRLK